MSRARIVLAKAEQELVEAERLETLYDHLSASMTGVKEPGWDSAYFCFSRSRQ
jgi:hypothetical protein